MRTPRRRSLTLPQLLATPGPASGFFAALARDEERRAPDLADEAVIEHLPELVTLPPALPRATPPRFDAVERALSEALA